MKISAVISLVAIFATVAPCQAQILKELEQGLLGGQGQNGQQQLMPGAPGMYGGQMAPPPLIGNVNLPPGQYMMTNVQTGQAFYVIVQGGQMYLSQGAPQMMAPGQMTAPGQFGQQPPPSGMGGLIKNELGNILQNKMAPQQQVPQGFPGQ